MPQAKVQGELFIQQIDLKDSTKILGIKLLDLIGSAS